MARKKDPTVSSNDPTTAYAEAVCAGDIIAGPHVRDACRRHLKDLKTAEARGLVWDEDQARHVLEFFEEVLRLNGGEFEGQPYHLLGWQQFIVGSLFGWLRTDGYRRFRVAYVETGKGSGKSPLAAGIGLYGLVADKEARAEIYAAATKKDQAMILFRDAVAMVDQSPALSARLPKSGATGREWNLAYLEMGSFFRPISADDGQSGPRPHMALLDEIHEHKTNRTVEMMRAGTKWRRQALIFMITNSGSNQQSVAGEYHDYGTKVASGQIEDDAFFSYICALDEGEDPFQDPTCWPKANPSLGITIKPEYLQEQVRQARGMPSKESIVRRLNFCQWVEADQPWLSREVWMHAGDDYSLEGFAGRRGWAGLDLSSTQDLTSLVVHFEPTEDDPVWRELAYFWLPGDGLSEKQEKDRVPYINWREKGWIKTMPGKAISRLSILRELAELVSYIDLRGIAYDRWRIEDLKMLIDQEGFNLPRLVPFGQGYKDMAPAVDEYERRLLNDELKHNRNPVQTWCAANAVVISDPAGNRKVAKDRAIGRVDGIVAAVMATGLSIKPQEDTRSVYEERGIMFL